MWISAAEYSRMGRALDDALQRAIDAEKRLAEERKRLDDLVASERQSKDWLTLQLASRVITKHGGYGLDEKPVPVEAQPNPKGFIREPTYEDDAKLEFYKQCAVNAGKSIEDAVDKWEAEMRGETIAYTDQEQ